MKVLVLGANGGLGRNVVDAAREAGHEVIEFVRDLNHDARNAEHIRRAGGEVVFFCVNPRFSRWLDDFPPLLQAAITACRASGARLVFPGNVWIYGPGDGREIDESRAPSPTSQRGRLRAEMEESVRTSGVRHAIVRLPEFYGPNVVSLTARVFAAKKHVAWPGDIDANVEIVYMPDAARAMVRVGCAENTDGETFHIPAARTTPRAFVRMAGKRAWSVPPFALRIAGLFDETAAGAADIAHLWTDPVLLDGAKYRQWFGEIPMTPYEEGIANTRQWFAAHSVRLQG